MPSYPQLRDAYRKAYNYYANLADKAESYEDLMDAFVAMDKFHYKLQQVTANVRKTYDKLCDQMEQLADTIEIEDDLTEVKQLQAIQVQTLLDIHQTERCMKTCRPAQNLVLPYYE